MDLSIETVLLQLFVLFLLAKVFGLICERLGVPAVIGEILAGILVATTVPLSLMGGGMQDLSLFSLLGLDQDLSFFEIISELGVIFLLFTVGLETPYSELRKVGVTATVVAGLGVIAPFIVGYVLMIGFGHGQVEALFIGAAMVATSVGITARVISDLGLTQSIEARVIIGAAVIDDVMGMIVLAIVVGIASGGSSGLWNIVAVSATGIIFVLAVIFIGSIMMPRARKRVQARSERKAASRPADVLCVEKKRPTFSPLPLALLVCFSLSFLASYIGLAAIIGAFLAGMAFAELKDKWPCTADFHPINEFLVPFFFLYTGMQVDIWSFGNVLVLAIVLTVLAALTKVLGCGLGSRKMGRKTATIIGVGMIPRGEVGIIVASIGLSMAVVSHEMFSVVVFMSMATTIVSPFLLAWAFRRKYGECRLPEQPQAT